MCVFTGLNGEDVKEDLEETLQLHCIVGMRADPSQQMGSAGFASGVTGGGGGGGGGGTGADAVSSGPRTGVGRWGEAGWPGPVGRWERIVGSGPVGWWRGTLLSYWRCTEETEDRMERGGRRREVRWYNSNNNRRERDRDLGRSRST